MKLSLSESSLAWNMFNWGAWLFAQNRMVIIPPVSAVFFGQPNRYIHTFKYAPSSSLSRWRWIGIYLIFNSYSVDICSISQIGGVGKNNVVLSIATLNLCSSPQLPADQIPQNLCCRALGNGTLWSILQLADRYPNLWGPYFDRKKA